MHPTQCWFFLYLPSQENNNNNNKQQQQIKEYSSTHKKITFKQKSKQTGKTQIRQKQNKTQKQASMSIFLCWPATGHETSHGMWLTNPVTVPC
jgi:cytoskeletal protein RodZ